MTAGLLVATQGLASDAAPAWGGVRLGESLDALPVAMRERAARLRSEPGVQPAAHPGAQPVSTVLEGDETCSTDGARRCTRLAAEFEFAGGASRVRSIEAREGFAEPVPIAMLERLMRAEFGEPDEVSLGADQVTLAWGRTGRGASSAWRTQAQIALVEQQGVGLAVAGYRVHLRDGVDLVPQGRAQRLGMQAAQGPETGGTKMMGTGMAPAAVLNSSR